MAWKLTEEETRRLRGVTRSLTTKMFGLVQTRLLRDLSEQPKLMSVFPSPLQHHLVKTTTAPLKFRFGKRLEWRFINLDCLKASLTIGYRGSGGMANWERPL